MEVVSVQVVAADHARLPRSHGTEAVAPSRYPVSYQLGKGLERLALEARDVLAPEALLLHVRDPLDGHGPDVLLHVGLAGEVTEVLDGIFLVVGEGFDFNEGRPVGQRQCDVAVASGEAVPFGRETDGDSAAEDL